MERPTGMDAKEWTAFWMDAIRYYSEIPFDEGCMVGWFANVAMAGYDAAMQKVATEITSRDRSLMREAIAYYCKFRAWDVDIRDQDRAIAAVVAAHEEGK